MAGFQSFDETFEFDNQHSYQQHSVHAIEEHRRRLEGLFIDRVLKLIGLKRPAKLYPPKTNADLKSLHQTIVSSQAPDHIQISVLYYILLDCDASTRRQDHSDAFQQKTFLPSRYQIYMKGLWHMDHMDFEIALQYLTHPSLIPTFSDEIIEVLARHSGHEDPTLVLSYYHTVNPTLTSIRAVEYVITAIAQTSVTEAFYFGRGLSEVHNKHVLEVLIRSVLQNASGETVAERCQELVNLPMSPEEESWFEAFLTVGDGQGLRRASDTLIMRYIGTGHFTEALSIEDVRASKSFGGLSWKMMQKAIREGQGQRLDSKTII